MGRATHDHWNLYTGGSSEHASARDSEAAYPLLSQTYHIAFGSAEPASLVTALRANPSTSAPPAFSLRFSGYRALVIGAGNGIGRRIAVRLVDLRAFVVAVDRAQSAIESVERKLSPHCKGIVADLSELQSLRTVVSEAGSVDLLVNSAGILVLEPFGEQTVDVWDKTMDINARCCWFLSHELGKGMAERRQSAIVNISSQSSSVAVSEKHMAYSTSKAAVDHTTRLSAYALAIIDARLCAGSPALTDQFPWKLLVLELASGERLAAAVDKEIASYSSVPVVAVNRVGSAPEYLASSSSSGSSSTSGSSSSDMEDSGHSSAADAQSTETLQDAIRNEGHGAQRGADDLPAAADQLSPPWARATQLVQWYRSSGRRGRLHVALVTGEGALVPASANSRLTVCGRCLRQPEVGAGLAEARGTAQSWSPRCKTWLERHGHGHKLCPRQE